MALKTFTLFSDILGFKNKIVSISTQDEANKVFALLDRNQQYTERVNQLHNPVIDNSYDIFETMISDANVISYVCKENSQEEDSIEINEFLHTNFSVQAFIFILGKINSLIINLLIGDGYFLRGAISDKKIFWKGNRVIGEGLVEAYELESKKAIYPRVILNESISNDSSFIDTVNQAYKLNILKQDFDGVWFYDYITSFIGDWKFQYTNASEEEQQKSIETMSTILSQHKQHIETNLTRLYNEIKTSAKNTMSSCSILPKYIWLRDYHNYTIRYHFGIESPLTKKLEILI